MANLHTIKQIHYHIQHAKTGEVGEMTLAAFLN